LSSIAFFREEPREPNEAGDSGQVLFGNKVDAEVRGLDRRLAREWSSSSRISGVLGKVRDFVVQSTVRHQDRPLSGKGESKNRSLGLC